MKLMALADIHGQVKHIPLLANAAKDCDAILLAGDITDFGSRQQAVSILTALRAFGKPLLGVCGNCDPTEIDETLEQEGVSLMNNPVEMNGVIFIGFPYPASEESILSAEQYLTAQPQKPTILVSHQPAWGTDLDLQTGMRHKGNHTIRSFIEDHAPLVAINGHVHEARGIDQIGSTVMVNPGPFRNGCYAIIDLNNRPPNARLHIL